MAKREFIPAEQVVEIENFIKQYFAANGNPDTKAIIGISGGKDSTIAAALLVRALGSERVLGVMMPCGVQNDIHDAQEVCDILDIEAVTVNIGDAMKALTDAMPGGFSSMTDAYLTNTPARLRMATLYGIAANVGGRVCNTGNASEFFIGYTTKYGDLAGDFALLRNLTVREIYAIGDYLELPAHLVYKKPADGMSGKTDEDKTGIPYDAIDNYLIDGILPEMEVYEKMMAAHNRNIHKNVIMLPMPNRVGPYLRQNHFEDPWAF